MQDGARFFAYSTWSLMISLAIIVTTQGFLSYIYEPGWVGTLVLLGFGFLYLNLAYAAVKRYIRKVPAPTNMHVGLGIIIALPPSVWVYVSADPAVGTTDILIILVLILSCGLGVFYGNRAGIKARYEYIQALKEHQKKMEKAAEEMEGGSRKSEAGSSKREAES
ncbi:MAG: hypothetical protein JJU46_01095 [Balneolaceae bacterium]|nr:hypothetical protein [Balneolaceae bacterium]MCH8550145.1 hypothetical protein [Balneolaceae bacterium]